MSKNITFPVLILAVLLCAGPASAQLGDDPPPADARVASRLDALDMKYTIDSDGDFRVLFDMENDRTQLAFIRSVTTEYMNLEIREIWSFAYRAESGPFPQYIANRLLEDTFPKKLGAWAKMDDTAVFVVKLSANADKESLHSALVVALQAADQMEEELSGDTDEF